DRVALTNPATQAHDHADRGKLKTDALAERLLRINPEARITSIGKRFQDLTVDERDQLWTSDLILAMTDHFHTQALINTEAVAYAQAPVIFANCYIGCGAVEVTGTLPQTVASGGGCHRCHVKPRYDAYETGFQNPTNIASHALAADYLNALIGNLVLGCLHAQ